MAILIKGMEMPKNCYDCPLEHLSENYYGDVMSRWCPLMYKESTEDYDGQRHPDCPLVEVPKRPRYDADLLRDCGMEE